MVSSRQQYRYCHPTCLNSIFVVSLLLFALIVREHKINFEPSSTSSSLHYHWKIYPKQFNNNNNNNNNHNNNNSTNIINNVTLESVTTINEKEEEKEEEDQIFDNNKNDQNIRWPILQQKLCPNGIPNVTLGPTLFKLARTEFGITEKKTKKMEEKTKKKKETKTTDITNNNNNNDDDQHDENNNNEQNQHKFVNYFYKGGFGCTIYINENDPTNTILYVPIWKCANDQIHSYLHKLYNRQSNGHIRQHNNITSNSTATAMMALYDNDTYLENLKINDMKFLFHKQVQQKMNSNNNNNSTSLINGNDKDNDDDENNTNFFKFNNTNRSKPCLFTVLRDPISHFLSGYNEVEFRMIEQTNDSPSKNNSNLAPYTKLPPWARANNNSNNNNNGNVTTTTINDSNNNETMMQLEKRFIQFVQDVLEEHSSFYKYKFYKHFASMSRIIPFLNDLNLLHHHTSTSTSNNNNWYLSNLNNLTETFPTFLLKTCPNIGGRTTSTTSTSIMNDDNSNNNNNNNSTSKGTLMTTTTTRNSNGDDNDNEDVVVDPTTATAAMDSISTSSTTIMPSMEIKGLHQSSKDIYGTYQAAKNVWNSNSRVAKSLCILHSFDYACYDFSSGSDSSDGSNSGIPNICREVYESDLFYNGIILH